MVYSIDYYFIKTCANEIIPFCFNTPVVLTTTTGRLIKTTNKRAYDRVRIENNEKMLDNKKKKH